MEPCWAGCCHVHAWGANLPAGGTVRAPVAVKSVFETLRSCFCEFGHLYNEYYTVVRRYGNSVQVARTSFHYPGISVHYYVMNITQWWEDMEFMFEWQEHKIDILEVTCNHYILLLYTSRHTDDNIFDHFQKISNHFPKISEDSPKLDWRWHKCCRTFLENFQRLPTMSKDCCRLLRKTWRCFDHTQTNLSTI